jgi:hypothetical protein
MVSGVASGSAKSAMFGCARDLGTPEKATANLKAASRSSISTSTRQAPTTRGAAFDVPAEAHTDIALKPHQETLVSTFIKPPIIVDGAKLTGQL